MSKKRQEVPRLMTISKAAKHLDCHPNTLRDWEKKGLIKTVRIGVRKDRRFFAKDVARLMGVKIEEYKKRERKKELDFIKAQYGIK